MSDYKKQRIKSKISKVESWYDIELSRLKYEKIKMLKVIRDKCDHDMKWEHRWRDSIGGGYYVYRGTCKVCGLEINQEEKPEGIENIRETRDSIIMTM